jgi:hypothetical protein
VAPPPQDPIPGVKTDEFRLQDFPLRVAVGVDHELLRAKRAEARTEAFKQDYKKRSPVEGSLSELVRAHGARRSQYRGLRRVALRDLFLGAMLNVKRWVKAIVTGWRPQAQAAAM